MDTEKIVGVILSFILPPLAVFLKRGFTAQFWINILLCLFFWIPAIIHSLFITLKD